MVKPDAAIYHLALDRFGLLPTQAVFVDDNADNVAGAEAVGMHAVLFTDAAAFRARLVELQMLPSSRACPGIQSPERERL